MRKDRPLIKFAKKHFNNGGITALEVGVFYGGNAVSIMRNLNIKKLYLVDPYEDYKDYNHSTNNWNIKQIEYNKIYEKIKKRIWKYGSKVELIRKRSSDIDIDGGFDFIYLDGNYGILRDDFDKFFPLLNESGVIGGYAFMPCHRDVVETVYRIVDDYGLELHGDCREWWIINKDGGYKK